MLPTLSFPRGRSMKYSAFKVEMGAPDDVSEGARLLDEGTFKADEVVAILGKTEGNGGVNDFTRGYATFACEALLAERLGVSRAEVGKRAALVMSGGTEGIVSPHLTVFARREVDVGPAGGGHPGEKRLA